MNETMSSAGLSITIKQQVDSVQLAIQRFKRQFDKRRKTNLEINSRLLQVQKITIDGINDLKKSVDDQIGSLNQALGLQLKLQRNELQYLGIQCKTTDAELNQLQLANKQVNLRVKNLQDNVGL